MRSSKPKFKVGDLVYFAPCYDVDVDYTGKYDDVGLVIETRGLRRGTMSLSILWLATSDGIGTMIETSVYTQEEWDKRKQSVQA